MIIKIAYNSRIYGFSCQEEEIYSVTSDGELVEYTGSSWCNATMKEVEKSLNRATRVMCFDGEPYKMRIDSVCGMADQYNIIDNDGNIIEDNKNVISADEAIEILER